MTPEPETIPLEESNQESGTEGDEDVTSEEPVLEPEVTPEPEIVSEPEV